MIVTVINNKAIYNTKCNSWIRELRLEIPINESQAHRQNSALSIFFDWMNKVDGLEKVNYLRYDLLSFGSFLYPDDPNKISNIICNNSIDVKGLCVYGMAVNFDGKEALSLKMFFGSEESTMDKMDSFNNFVKMTIEILIVLLNMNDNELNLCRSLINSIELKYMCRNILSDLNGTIKKDD